MKITWFMLLEIFKKGEGTCIRQQGLGFVWVTPGKVLGLKSQLYNTIPQAI